MAGSNTKQPGGRPTVMTPETIGKLEQAFAYGASDKEACFYAGINPESLYKYQREHPEFTERKEALKESPILRARETVVKSLDDPKNAQWYLERKKKDEFSQRSEITGDNQNPIRMMVEKFGLDKIEGGNDDGKDDGDVQVSSPENS